MAGFCGFAGADGGSRSGYQALVGQPLTYGGQTWSGGGIGTNYYVDGTWYGYGGSGGGAAYGANGGGGGNGYLQSNGNPTGGHGGAGGNASVMNVTPNYGDGGAGGCGGGGGGCPGQDRKESSYTGWGTDGQGGSYSNGHTGGAGYALVYY